MNIIETLSVTFMSIIAGYFLPKIDAVENFFRFLALTQWQLQVLLSSMLLLCLLIPYILHLKKEKFLSKEPIKPIKLTKTHRTILQQFKIKDGELLSAESLEYLTGIDSFNVRLVLDELLSHSLIYATNLDETEGWLYVLSELGRKFIAKNLT